MSHFSHQISFHVSVAAFALTHPEDQLVTLGSPQIFRTLLLRPIFSTRLEAQNVDQAILEHLKKKFWVKISKKVFELIARPCEPYLKAFLMGVGRSITLHVCAIKLHNAISKQNQDYFSLGSRWRTFS